MAKDRSSGGGVNISGGRVNAQNIAGRDINVGTQISRSEINEVFQPVVDAIQRAPVDTQAAALSQLDTLKQEAGKGEHADHSRMKSLIDGIVGLVPEALKALGAAFAAPVLKGVAAPVTQFLLGKIVGQ